ncbi:MAG: AI-2E family transporter [Sulfurimonas sp.]|uniref:AI-2E family transporter n=1 Tax=Sulfurimonas sp. TaxID=2022749 RepID=UPI0025DE9662|nr:AI-2E family transporter [Sulfurimonas sp.]MCK9491850.1 AI-2E family transporter [Sulfurimonas sp.]
MQERNFGYIFIVSASVIVILAGIKSASEIVVPFLLSLFIAIILSPSYNYFNKKGLPNVLSLTLVMSLFVILLLLVAKLIGSSVQEFSSNISVYEQQLSSSFDKLFEIFMNMGFELPKSELLSIIDPKQIMQLSSGIVQGIGSMFTNGFVILLSVIFMLLESQHFTDKVAFASGNRGMKEDIQEIVGKIKRYMVLKAIISLFTAFVIYVALLIIGTDYAFLWAVLAFMLNFIPNIGSIIAAIPVVLLTLVQLGSLSAFMVSVLYIIVNVVIGSVIEPKVMGKGLGLSTLVVFLSLIFWGWLLGIVGMLLSIPLTMMAKIVFDSNKETKFIAVLLGTADNLVEKK